VANFRQEDHRSQKKKRALQDDFGLSFSAKKQPLSGREKTLASEAPLQAKNPLR